MRCREDNEPGSLAFSHSLHDYRQCAVNRALNRIVVETRVLPISSEIGSGPEMTSGEIAGSPAGIMRVSPD
jgi:hypothetical protein